LAQEFIFRLDSPLCFNAPMAAVADSIDFLCDLFTGKDVSCKKGSCHSRSGLNAGVGAVYVMFFVCFLTIYKNFSNRDFSGILTMSSGIQCLAFMLLTLKVRSQKSVAGISSRALEMYVLVFCTRLCSTTIKNGYIPVDKSGDHMYQLGDILSILLAVQLIYCIHKTHNSTYQADKDTLNVAPLVPVCIMLAAFIHGDMNRNPLFDTIWTTSLNLDCIAMVPQLWMLTKIGGEVEGMTSHFVVAMMASRLCSFSFWYYGYEELSKHEDDVNLAGKQIVLAHIIQLLLCADFLYYYATARLGGKAMILPTEVEI